MHGIGSSRQNAYIVCVCVYKYMYMCVLSYSTALTFVFCVMA